MYLYYNELQYFFWASCDTFLFNLLSLPPNALKVRHALTEIKSESQRSIRNNFFIGFFFKFCVYFFRLHEPSLLCAAVSGYGDQGATLQLQCSGFSWWWLLSLRSTGFRHAGCRSCSTQAQQLYRVQLVSVEPTLVFLAGESQEQGSLVGCRLWRHTELDTTKVTQQQQQ